MNIKASMLYAYRLLFPKAGGKSNARRSLIGAVFCIGMSLIPLVVVLVVTDGMISGITSRFIELSSYHLQAIPRTTVENMNTLSAYNDDKDEIQQVDGVTSAFVERQSIGLLAGPTGRQGVTIRCVEPSLFTENTAFTSLLTVHEGSLSLSDSKSILVGKKVADTLAISVGDTVRLITARSSANGKMTPKLTSFTVEGIISCGYQELDALWIFIPIETGFSFISSDSSNTFIGIQTSDAFSSNLTEIQSSVKKVLNTRYKLYSWQEINRTQYENFASTKTLLLFIMFLIVLVASVNVSSALVMLVMERRKEIAVLKSIGASEGGITTSFILTGFCTGLLGVVTGLPLGLLCAVNVNTIIRFVEKIVNTFSTIMYNISNAKDYVSIHLLDPAYYLETIPIVVPFKELFIIAAGTLVLSVIVSIIPSVKAGRERPINTLRKI